MLREETLNARQMKKRNKQKWKGRGNNLERVLA